jgi:NAD(P)-dependent dehydrogenase (short-subunit alcohol dehydrogenase family)
MRRLEGRTAIVTGSGSAGFGRSIALRVAQEGANVVVADLDDAGATETVRQVKEIGSEAHLVVGDISIEVGARRLVTEAAERFGRVDILVNNAGIAPPESVDSWDAPESSWDRVIQINLKTVYLCARASIPRMIEQGGGSIVNIASIAATRACSGASYAAAKAGMLGYTHQVAPELASRNVRVNCVSPGFMRTPMSTGERRGLDPVAQEAQLQQMGSHVPMRRMGGVDDIAAAVAYLASDDAAYVTGQEIVVDGGFLCAPVEQP